MKYAVVFLLSCLALASAAPHIIAAYPGLVASWPGIAPVPLAAVAPVGPVAPSTIVAGPTVVNGVASPGRIVVATPVGPAIV